MKPAGVARDAAGNLYVADQGAHVLLRVDPEGTFTLVAGLPRVSGSEDGTGSDARFDRPWGVAVGGDGSGYVADAGNHTIRKVSPSGLVTTFAGSARFVGSVDFGDVTADGHVDVSTS